MANDVVVWALPIKTGGTLMHHSFNPSSHTMRSYNNKNVKKILAAAFDFATSYLHSTLVKFILGSTQLVQIFFPGPKNCTKGEPLVDLYHVSLETKVTESSSLHRNANDLFWNKNVVSRRQPLLSDGY